VRMLENAHQGRGRDALRMRESAHEHAGSSKRCLLALVLFAGCGGDDEVVSSATGGDEMPEDEMPGPRGPSCGSRAAHPGSGAPDDVTGAAQPGTIARVVALRGDRAPPAAPMPEAPASGRAPSGALTRPTLPTGATTGSPHVHERWGEPRKLELSYCITGLYGDDAELEAGHHMLTRALADVTAEWERATGANFVHVASDDAPAQPAIAVNEPSGAIVLQASCASASPYIGVLTYPFGAIQAITNPTPQTWDDPRLEPQSGHLSRTIVLNTGLLSGASDSFLRAVLRHELGHVMGFLHEEVNAPDPDQDGCPFDLDPRPLTPIDPESVMTTPGCSGVLSDDAEVLTHYDRLSGFYLHHTPRARFETRAPSLGYRYGGVVGGGAEILWHTEGSAEGVLWRPLWADGSIGFVAEPFPYLPPEALPEGGWFPSASEVVVPLRLGAPNSLGLLFHGPGPNVDDAVVFNAGGSTTTATWRDDAYSVPVVGRFDGGDLDRDVVYLYQPGTEQSAVLVAEGEQVSVVRNVPQQAAFALPLAAPYRGSGYPDDVVWLEPHEGRVTTWRLGDGLFALAEATRVAQGTLGLARGENVPAIGDFDGDGRADIMWQGVSNQAAGHAEITDVLWLSESTPDQLAFAVVPKSVGHTFRPFVGDFDGDGIDDIFWHRSWGLTTDGPSALATDPSYVWYFDGEGAHTAEAFVLEGDFSPYVGDFDADGCHDIGWFDAIGDALHVWRCLPGERDFDCGTTMPTPPNAAPVGMHWGF
jgi:hypothetical protein